jgi:hypothetical protein
MTSSLRTDEERPFALPPDPGISRRESARTVEPSTLVDEAPFPLPLSPFEQLFVSDDFPAYPMHFFYRLRFDGRLHRRALEKAIEIAVARHPLLSAVVNSSAGRSEWVSCDGQAPEMHWLQEEPDVAFPPAELIDLRTRPGLVATAVVGRCRSDLVLQFHHATCDGIGAMDFVSDLLTAYSNVLAGTDRYRFKVLDAAQLRGRDALPLSGPGLARWLVRQTPRLVSLWRFFRRRPAPVIPHRADMERSRPVPDYPEGLVCHLTREESAALAGMAQGSETSLNALLARDLVLALGQWRKHQDYAEDAWLRLMLPVNMRTPFHRQMPAANVVSTVFLDTRLTNGTPSETLLERLDGLMQRAKRDNLGIVWLVGLRLLQRLPRGWAKARRSRRRCLYSALFTNVGAALAASPLPRADRRLRIGDLILEDVEFLPAARPLQCVGFGVTSYAGRLSIAMRYQSEVITSPKAKELLDLYIETLRASVLKNPARSRPGFPASASGSGKPDLRQPALTE